MFRLKGCGRCGGDLWCQRDLDEGQAWRCLLCGRSVARPTPLARARQDLATRVFGRRSGAIAGAVRCKVA